MLGGKIVFGDQEVDGIEVVFGVLGEGVHPTHEAAGSRSQGAKPAFNVVGFAFVLVAAAVRSLWERCCVGVPKVAAGGTSPVALGQEGPQVAGALQTAVAQGVQPTIRRVRRQSATQSQS